MEWKPEEEQRLGLGGGHAAHAEGPWRVATLPLVCAVRRSLSLLSHRPPGTLCASAMLPVNVVS